MKPCPSKLIVTVDPNKKVMRKVAAQEIGNLDELQEVYLNVMKKPSLPIRATGFDARVARQQERSYSQSAPRPKCGLGNAFLAPQI